MPEVYQSSNAVENIKSIIEAMANAKNAQVELQKQVMLKKIGDQMELQQNKAKLQQGVESNINQKQANLDWATGGAGSSPVTTPPATPMASPLNPTSGIADSGTPSAVASPTAPAPASPMPTPQAPSPTPMLNAGAQRPNSPVLSSPVNAPSFTGAVGNAPIVPPTGVSIPSPIGKPLPPPQGRIIMGPDGKPMLNPNADSMDNKTYSQIYSKWRSGQPLTSGESSWVQKKFSNNTNGQPLPKPSAPTHNPTPITNPQNVDANGKVQSPINDGSPMSKLPLIEKKFGAPPGSMWINPATGDAEINPFAKSRIDAQQRAEANYDVNQPFREKLEQDKLEKTADDRLQKVLSNRSGGLGLQDMKVNQAIDLRNGINSYYDPKTGNYNIPPVMHTEIALGLARLLAPNGQVGVQLTNELKQGTLQENINKVAAFFGEDPRKWGGPSQSVAQTLIQAIDRQGLTAEGLRDKYFKDIDNILPKNLNPDTKEYLRSQRLGSSFKDVLNNSPDKQNPNVSTQSNTNTGTQQYQEGQTATNPKTGQKLTYRGGQWQ